MISVQLLCFLIIAAVVLGEEHVGYKFEYGVDDPHTKDHKSQYEHRDGDYVVGSYSLQQPDGKYRTVNYKSGPHSGFEAEVEITDNGHHLEPQGGGETGPVGVVPEKNEES